MARLTWNRTVEYPEYFHGESGAASLLAISFNLGGWPGLGREAFLLAPGGQDYVGENSYDLQVELETAH